MIYLSGLGSYLNPQLLIFLEHVCPSLLIDNEVDNLYWRNWVLRFVFNLFSYFN